MLKKFLEELLLFIMKDLETRVIIRLYLPPLEHCPQIFLCTFLFITLGRNSGRRSFGTGEVDGSPQKFPVNTFKNLKFRY